MNSNPSCFSTYMPNVSKTWEFEPKGSCPPQSIQRLIKIVALVVVGIWDIISLPYRYWKLSSNKNGGSANVSSELLNRSLRGLEEEVSKLVDGRKKCDVAGKANIPQQERNPVGELPLPAPSPEVSPVRSVNAQPGPDDQIALPLEEVVKQHDKRIGQLQQDMQQGKVYDIHCALQLIRKDLDDTNLPVLREEVENNSKKTEELEAELHVVKTKTNVILEQVSQTLINLGKTEESVKHQVDSLKNSIDGLNRSETLQETPKQKKKSVFRRVFDKDEKISPSPSIASSSSSLTSSSSSLTRSCSLGGESKAES